MFSASPRAAGLRLGPLHVLFAAPTVPSVWRELAGNHAPGVTLPPRGLALSREREGCGSSAWCIQGAVAASSVSTARKGGPHPGPVGGESL